MIRPLSTLDKGFGPFAADLGRGLIHPLLTLEGAGLSDIYLGRGLTQLLLILDEGSGSSVA